MKALVSMSALGDDTEPALGEVVCTVCETILSRLSHTPAAAGWMLVCHLIGCPPAPSSLSGLASRALRTPNRVNFQAVLELATELDQMNQAAMVGSVRAFGHLAERRS